jgi:hypothetical protein
MRRPGERGRVIFVLAANLLAGLSACRSEPAPVVQPIAFDHALHMKKDMECATCHEHADTSIYATLPSNDVCMGCHDEPNGKNPEEPKVRELAAKGPIPWVQVNHLAGNVYFSHAAHVTLGKMECKVCHGDMAQRSRPVDEPQIAWLTMGACEKCHEERHARNECLTCHK